jgi:dipeptidyl aminopeptidase/acylaminoacyl peptidase
VVMTPPSYDSKKTYPVMIWLHGGPLRQTSLSYHPYHSYGIYDAMLKLLQKNNVIVLKLDYRGSFGQGRAYSEAIKDNFGKSDIDDVMQAVQYMKNQYHTSDVYLSGNSYGGYMSLKAVVEHPDTFKGVFSINGVTDWESLLVKMQTSIFNIDFNGLPNSDNRNLYDQASIISKIGNLGNQRIEILQGEADSTIPLWQATLLYGKLKDAGKNVNLTTYKGEDHVFAIKKNINDVCVRMFGLMEIKPDKECTK